MAKRVAVRKLSAGAAEYARRLEGIVASAMDGIITIDESQRVVLFNPAAESMFGISVNEALGLHISHFIPERHRQGHAAHIELFVKTGVTDRRMGALGAVSGLRVSGEEFPLEASISQVQLGSQKLATVILRDITEREAGEAARQLLAREVDHRAKNALAVVQALVSLTRASTIEAFVEAVRGRVQALGRAHSLLAENRWEGADLMQIIADETEPYHRPGQIEVSGSTVTLTADSVQPLSLLIHELATNAVKYGALSVDQGRVAIQIQILPSLDLELRWIETGGPSVQAPVSKGFGATLIAQVATRQLGGALDIGWPREGMRLIATLPPAAYRADATQRGRDLSDTNPTPAAAGAAGRVLVVEDEVLIAMQLCATLAGEGWEVVGPAATVDEALRLLDAAAPIDVAVLDVNLGGSLVYPVAERLHTVGVPFVFCTGYERAGIDARYGGYRIVRKPVSAAQLTDELQRATLAA